MFEKKGTFVIASDATTEDALMEVVLEAGADDVVEEDGFFIVTCEPSVFGDIKTAVDGSGIELVSSEVAMIPGNMVSVDTDTARKALAMLETLEDHEDIQKVYSNLDIPDELAEE